MHRSPHRLLPTLAVLLLCSLPAEAHFLWARIVGRETGPALELVLSDGPLVDTPVSLASQVEGVVARTARGEVALEGRDWGALALLDEGDDVAWLERDMGLFTPPRGGEPLLLHYCAKGCTDLEGAARVVGQRTEVVLERDPADPRGQLARVLFEGRPAAGAQVRVERGGEDEREVLETDAQGRVRLEPGRRGLLAIRARVEVLEPGERDGSAYERVHHYATLTVSDTGASAPSSRGDALTRLDDALARVGPLPAGVGIAGRVVVASEAGRWLGDFDALAGVAELEVSLPEAPAGLAERVRAELLDMLATPWAALRPAEADGLALAARDGHPLGRLVRSPGGRAWRIGEHRVHSYEHRDEERVTILDLLDHERGEDGLSRATRLVRTRRDAHTGEVLACDVLGDAFASVQELVLPRSRTIRSRGPGDGGCLTLELRNLELERRE